MHIIYNIITIKTFSNYFKYIYIIIIYFAKNKIIIRYLYLNYDFYSIFCFILFYLYYIVLFMYC